MIRKYQLKNGLKVLLVQTKKSPVVSAQCWVRTGSADEKKGEEGLSHFIEHLVFKGTNEYKTGEIAQLIEGSGGQLNAYTSFDQTVFYVTLSSQFADMGLHALREMMGFPEFDPIEIDNEREVVIEEIKRGKDSPGRRASQALFSTLYKKHPYGIPVIGFEKNIKTVSRKKISKYYKDRYTPSNMFLVVTGDFEYKNIKVAIDKNFGPLVKTPKRIVKRKAEPIQKSPRINIETADFKQAHLYVAWPGVKASSKEAIILDLMCVCLGQGESSRLVRYLRNELGIVQSIGASSYSPLDNGLIAISAVLQKENLSKALDEICMELKKFILEPPTSLELVKAARALESDRFYSLETVDGLSQLVGQMEFYYKNPEKMDEMMKLVDQTKASDIQKIAKKYFKPENLNLIYLAETVSKSDKSAIDQFKSKWKVAYKEAVSQKIVVGKPPRRKKIKWSIRNLGEKKGLPQLVKLSSGASLLMLKSKDSPVVSIKQAFLGGVKAEPEKLAGINNLLSRTWTTGTTSRSEETLNAEIDSLASSISSFGGRNTTGLSMTTLSAFSEEAFEIFQDVFLNPSFSEETLAREKVFVENQIRSRDDNPSRICLLKMMEEMFGRHPYHRDPLGEMDTVANCNRLSLLEQFQRIRNPQNAAFSIVGDFNEDKWVEHFSELVGAIDGQTGEWPPIESYKLSKNRHVYVEQKKEQSHFCLAFPGLRVNDPKRIVLDVMQSVLSGQGGRLFIELRDKASLAYSVSPVRMDGLDGGYFGAYIGCSPEKVEKAREMMHIELDKLCTTEIPADELMRAKRSVAGRHDIGLQRNGSIANEMLLNHLYQLPFDEYLNYSDQVFQVSAEDIRSLAQALFKQSYVTSLVGPQNCV